MKFTDRFLKSLKPKDKPYDVNEGRGFTVKVLPTGRTTFYIRYTFDGKQKLHRLGNYPEMSLAEAREEYNECVRLIGRGEDPSTLKKAAKIEAASKPAEIDESLITVKWMAEKYVKWSEDNHSPDWATINDLTIRKYIIPAWGPRHILSIRKRDAIELMEYISKTGGPGAARNAQRVARGLFAYAEQREYIDASPFTKLVKAVPDLQSVSRKRTLSEIEIRHVWNVVSKGMGSDPVRRALLLILVTAQRPEECAEIMSSEIEGDWWTLPPDRNKMKRYHRVYLTETAKKLIGDKEGIKFKGRGTEGPITRSSMSKKIAKGKYLGLPRWTPHDLRRTARTHMARIGIPSEHAEAVVNHAKEGMEAVYNLYEYDDEKKEALLKWEAELLRIVSTEEPLVSGPLPDSLD